MSSTLTNQQIVWQFKKAKAVLEIIDSKPFRARAYQNAIETISGLDQELSLLVKSQDISKLPGIGKELSEKIDDLVSFGKSDDLEKLYSKVPAGMFELMQIPGIGSKKAYRLSKEFGLDNPKTALSKIKTAAKNNSIAELEGFGEKSQADILKNISQLKPKSTRMRLDQADTIANQIVEFLSTIQQVAQAMPMGSVRRRNETVGDIDIGVETDDHQAVTNQIKKWSQVSSVTATGKNLIRIILLNGKQADIKYSDKKNFGAMLQHFTGSRSHNIALRTLAQKRNYSLSEHGVKKGSEKIDIPKEDKLYSLLDLPIIPPELREDGSEVTYFLHHKRIQLVELQDIQSDMHTHSNYNWKSSHDYGESIDSLLTTASGLNYKWLVIGDHQPAKSEYEHTNYTKLITQRNDWITTNYKSWKNKVKNNELKIYTNLEVDLAKDGTLMISDEAAKQLDFVTASIHSSFTLSYDKQTQRLIKAISHPSVNVLAHPSARLINKRSGISVNWDAVFKACSTHKVALEINANPRRLDLPDSLIHQAKKMGVNFSLGSDAHSKDHLQYMHYAVSQARRGWLVGHDIINTYTNKQFEAWLKK